MGNEMSMGEDPIHDCPLLDRLPTKEELMEILPAGSNMKSMLSFMLNNWDSQRELDSRWALLCANQGEIKSRTFAQWKELYRISGMNLVSSSSRNRSQDLLDFAQLNKSSSYTLIENFVPPKTIPRKCDHCDTLLKEPKFCICGEVYCNERCRGKERLNHRRQCEMVQENNSSAMQLIVQWQRKQGITMPTSNIPREPPEELLLSSTTLRDNVLSFGGQKVVEEVFDVYKLMIIPERIPDLRNLANGNGPAAVHASYLYGKICDDPVVKAAPKKHSMKYIQYAADQGLGAAWVLLGNIARGKGDIKTAKECWFHALTICRIPEASYNLGVMYGLGYYGPVDYPMALVFYQEAVDSPLPSCDYKTKTNKVGDNIFYGLYTANNENQSVFVSQARNNLRVVQRSCTTPAKVIRYVDPPNPSTNNNNKTDTRPKKSDTTKCHNKTDAPLKESDRAKNNDTAASKAKEHDAQGCNNKTYTLPKEGKMGKNINTTITTTTTATTDKQHPEEAVIDVSEELINGLESCKLSYLDDSNVIVDKDDIQPEEKERPEVAKESGWRPNQRKKKKKKNKKDW